MKALILSDIHSNFRAIQNIWQIERDSDRIYCAGDVVAYGPSPKETIEWLMSRQAVCVQGNHDLSVVSSYRQRGRSEEAPLFDQSMIYHNASSLSEAHISFLEGLPASVTFSLDDIQYGMTHAVDDTILSAGSIQTYNLFVAQRFPSGSDGPVTRVLYGHSHRQAMSRPGECAVWLNPGPAIAVVADPLHQPNFLALRDGRAYYCTITDGSIELKHVEYHQ